MCRSAYVSAHMTPGMTDLHLRGRGGRRSHSAQAVTYPDSLNPFGSTNSCDNITTNPLRHSYDEEKNPFSTEEDEAEERRDYFPEASCPSPPPPNRAIPHTPTPAPRKKFLESLTFDRRQNGISNVQSPLSRSASLKNPAPRRPFHAGQGDHARVENDETDSCSHQSPRRPAPDPPIRATVTADRLAKAKPSQPSVTRSPCLPASPRRLSPSTPVLRNANLAKSTSPQPPLPKQPVSALQTSFKTPLAKEKQRRTLKSLVRTASFSLHLLDGNYRDFLDL